MAYKAVRRLRGAEIFCKNRWKNAQVQDNEGAGECDDLMKLIGGKQGQAWGDSDTQ